jgi:hypothetical protein
MTPLKISTIENNKTARTPITSTIGLIGERKPVSGTLKRAKPERMPNRYNQIGLSILNSLLSTDYFIQEL